MPEKPKVESDAKDLALLEKEKSLIELAEFILARKAGSRILEAEKIILVDAAGTVRGRLEVQTDGSASLILSDKAGKPRAWIGSGPDDSAYLSLKDKFGRISFEQPGSFRPSEESEKILSPAKSSRTVDDVVAALWGQIETRLELIELKSRRLRILGGVLLGLFLMGLAGLGLMLSRLPGVHDPLAANGLVIHDKEGVRRAWLGQRQGKAQLEFFDKDDKARLSLGLSEEGQPTLTMYDPEKKMMAELGLGLSGGPGLKLVGPDSFLVAVPGSISNINIKPQKTASSEVSKSPEPPAEPKKEAKEVPGTIAGKSEKGSKPEPSPETKIMFLAYPQGKSYHYPTCSWVKGAALPKLRKFSSAGEASKAGYRPCPRCRPPAAD